MLTVFLCNIILFRPHHYAIWCSYLQNYLDVCHCKLRFLWTDLEFNNGDIYGQKTWCQLTSSFETLGTSFIIVTEFTTVSNFRSDSSQYPSTYIVCTFQTIMTQESLALNCSANIKLTSTQFLTSTLMALEVVALKQVAYERGRIRMGRFSGFRGGQGGSGGGGQRDSCPTNLITAAEMETLIPHNRQQTK